jgi:hypothetical protein
VQNGFPAVDFGGVRLVSSTRLVPGRWHHLAATKVKLLRKLASTTLYVDGVATTLTVRNGAAVACVPGVECSLAVVWTPPPVLHGV